MPTVEPLTLITTKLHRPPVTDNLVPRPRLMEQLNRGLSGPLTLVCAPAGFGKSTLVSWWIEAVMASRGGVTSPLPSAWLSLDESDSDPSRFLQYLVAAVRTVFPDACVATLGYLADEVLSRQPAAIQKFLLMTSIRDRFSVALCEAVVGTVVEGAIPGGNEPELSVRACVDWLERANLFVTHLDNTREWYRYHHLFQELLQRRLSAEMAPGEVNQLHRLASAWFEAHGLLDEAIHHALAAGDRDLAARYIVAGLRDALNREDRPTLERWLRLLPQEMIQRDPGLLMIRAWALQLEIIISAWWLTFAMIWKQRASTLPRSSRVAIQPTSRYTAIAPHG